MQWATHVSDVFTHFPTPPAPIEICSLAGNGSEVFVVINHGSNRETVQLPRPMKDALADSELALTLEMRPYGVSILVND
jgi:hypothetical protein